MESYLGQFEAFDSAGSKHTIHVHQTYARHTDVRGGIESYAIERSLSTDDGSPVLRKARGVYELVFPNGERLTSDDPNAP